MEADGLLKLASLLQQSDQEAESGEAQTDPFTPGSIGPPPPVPKVSKPVAGQSKDIWNTSEIDRLVAYSDPRPAPDYEMKFLQAVNTEDLYLGMGNKHPGTASCESMVVRVKLNGTKNSSEIQLDIKENLLLLTTPIYYLSLNLPHTVDDTETRAQWDIDTDTLILTLKLKRVYDFLNF